MPTTSSPARLHLRRSLGILTASLVTLSLFAPQAVAHVPPDSPLSPPGASYRSDVEPVLATVTDDGTHITFMNPGVTAVGLVYGKPGEHVTHPDGTLDLEPGAQQTVAVRRPVIEWSAVTDDGADAGSGVVETAVEPGQPPVTRNDRIRVNGVDPSAGPYLLNRAYVLLNDLDPDRDHLEICDVTAPPSLQVEVREDRYPGLFYLDIVPVENVSGRYRVRYHACDGQWSTPGTLRVEVTRIDPVKVVVPRKGGRLRFTNPGTREVWVTYGKPSKAGAVKRCDGAFYLAPGETSTVRVNRTSIAYGAAVSPGSSAGEGVIDGIRLARRNERTT